MNVSGLHGTNLRQLLWRVPWDKNIDHVLRSIETQKWKAKRAFVKLTFVVKSMELETIMCNCFLGYFFPYGHNSWRSFKATLRHAGLCEWWSKNEVNLHSHHHAQHAYPWSIFLCSHRTSYNAWVFLDLVPPKGRLNWSLSCSKKSKWPMSFSTTSSQTINRFGEHRLDSCSVDAKVKQSHLRERIIIEISYPMRQNPAQHQQKTIELQLHEVSTYV